MVKKYVTGLVVGKFCPLHNGHLSVIKRAFELCDRVVILSYTSERFIGCEGFRRKEWLEYAVENITDDDSRGSVHILDDIVTIEDDAPEDEHRYFCADYLLNELDTTVQAVFTSESYGQGFADYLSKYFSDNLKTSITVDHEMIDSERNVWPISGTQARRALASKYRPQMLDIFLPHYVKRDFVRKILFLGAESTGKTTLVKALGDDRGLNTALEFGRYLFDKRKGKLQYEDMFHIGDSQITVEKYRASGLSLNEYLYCDTSPLTTAFYSKEMFGCVSPKLVDLVLDTQDSYYKIFLCAPDFLMVQDGTRKDEAFRQRGHAYYMRELEEFNYTVLRGSLEERIAQVKKELS
jgi:NadR type nicotinamide-nucleotide adenylyltransferase